MAQNFPTLPNEDEGSYVAPESSAPYEVRMAPTGREAAVRSHTGEWFRFPIDRRRNPQTGEVRYIIDDQPMTQEEARQHLERRARSRDYVGRMDVYPSLLTSPSSYFGAGQPRAFGFGDEVAGLGARVENLYDRVGIGSPGEGQLDPAMVSQEYNTRLTQERQSDPLGSASADMGASVPSMLIGGGPTKTLAQAVGQGARTGAAFGAVAGYGYGNEDRVGGALTGAAIGGTAGAGMPLLFAGAVGAGRQAVNLVKDRFSGRGLRTPAERAAFREMLSALETDGYSSEDALAAMRRWADSGAEESRLYEAFPNAETFYATVRGGLRGSGQATGQAIGAIDDTLANQGSRLTEETRGFFGLPQNAVVRRNEILTRRAAEADAAYEAATFVGTGPERRSIVVSNPKIVSNIQGIVDRLPASVINRTNELLRARGRPPISRGSTPSQLEMQDVDVLYKYLGDAANDRGSTAVTPAMRRELRVMQRRLYQNTPDEYQTAVNQFSSESQLLEALEFGREALSADPAELATRWAEMTPPQREQARIGFLTAMEGRVGGRRDRTDATVGLLDSEAARNRARVFFDSPEDFDSFMEIVNRSNQEFAAVRGIDPRGGVRVQGADAGQNLNRTLLGGAASASAGNVNWGVREALRGVAQFGNSVLNAGSRQERNRAIMRLAMLRPAGADRVQQQAFDEIISREFGNDIRDLMLIAQRSAYPTMSNYATTEPRDVTANRAEREARQREMGLQ